MGIFDKFKNPRKKDYETIAKNMCATAIDYAKDFDKEFDFSKSSITDLEEVLDFYSTDIPASRPTENQLWSMSIIFGSYLGETLLRNGLRNKGYVWTVEGSSDIPLLIGKDGNYITPIDKVYKRLVNGQADSVISFFRFAIDQFQ